MKALLKLGALAVFAVLLSSELTFAQERGKGNRPSPNAAVSQDIGSTTVSITYGRPGLKGRSLATLAKPGQVWRTGANESTVITFSEDVMFGGKEVKAGTYSLYTIPGENWTFILNSKLSWGTQYDESQDVVRVPAAVTTEGASSFERFTIYFDTLSDTKAHLNLQWGKTMTAIPITTK
ncbi:MAG TPA: hypothetical protein DF712_18130 [Balneola sp.]|jgi:hypothetical protein|nr:hypothetical protein [Bacteroidota bacterium]MAC05780.1 hypothetical protein [Balneola sp.]MAO77945.1 hypothetical protein [Balneola sp.]MBF65263.1 hypothetical protein [Balneola sp.]HAW80144.1 hypothetical protein [Balneola sp.]|tara:strand:- start:264 stop:800 length:537 start_codon:yes stop_codon:yes gene_type:complete